MQLDIKQSKHLIFGAGLIGCYLGGVLSYLGLNTRLVCRPVIKNKLLQGIKLSDHLGHVSPNIALQFAEQQQESAQELSKRTETDFLWLTVKCTGIEQAVRDIAPFVSANTVILCCQNGLGSEALLKSHFANNQVLRVMVPFNVVELSPGHYHRGSAGTLSIEYTEQTIEVIDSLVNFMQCDFLSLAKTKLMSALLWAKLQLNLGNSINALADIPVKAMLEQRAYRLVIAKLMHELLLVTDTMGITLPKVTNIPAHWIPKVLSLPNFLFSRVANSMLTIDPNVRTSMWWDVSQGKPTEINFLNGAIVEQANKLGLLCPANEIIIKLISELENSKSTKSGIKPPISAQTLLSLLK